MEVYPVKLGVTLGIVWGTCMLFLALFSSKYYGMSLFSAMTKLYTGCSQKNIFAKLLCGAFGFVDAFVGGWLVGEVYNRLPLKK
tara:strand:+ start:164 stop:415 length:252 start_codon:yes stop_codon:yes gene_type:complete